MTSSTISVALLLVTRLLEKVLGDNITVVYTVAGPASDPRGPRETLAVWLDKKPDFGSVPDFEVNEW